MIDRPPDPSRAQPGQPSPFSLLSPSTTAPGTRPGPGGATLVSTGLAGLDAILGGGAPLGRLLVLAVGGQEVSGGGRSAPAEDTGGGGAAVADLLARVFLAEGVARGQPGLWVQAGVEGRGDGDDTPSSSSPWWLPAPAPDRPARRSGAAAEDPPAGAGLRIAWQYRQYIEGNAGGGGSSGGGGARPGPPSLRPTPARGAEAGWAAAHDLSRRAPPPADPALLACVAANPDTAARVAAFIRTAPAGPAPPRRVALSGLGSPAWRDSVSCGDAAAAGGDPDGPAAWDAVIRTLRSLRSALRAGPTGGRDAPASVLVTLPARSFPPAALARAAAAADGLVALDALRSDSGLAALLPDTAAVIGLARAVRLPGVGAGGLARASGGGGGGGISAAVSATLHAVRLKRGRLTLVPADIDPDAEEALMGGRGGGGGGGGVCGAGPPGGSAAAALSF